MKYTITLLISSLLIMGSCQKKEKKIETEAKGEMMETPVKEESYEDNEMCFMQVISKDTLLLTVIKNGNQISGTYRSISFEKDKKTNIFNGTISGNTVTAVGTALGEGQTTVQEEIIFTLENNKAGVKFGEMIEGDDGVYRYKNKKSATSLFINKVDCLK